MEKFNMKTSNLKKKNDVYGNKKHHVKISNKFALLDNSHRISKFCPQSLCNHKMKHHELFVWEEYSTSLEQRKQATLQWLLDLSYIHDDNLNSLNKLVDIQEKNKE